MYNLKKQLRKRTGFVMMEVLVVLGILIVLIGLASGLDWAEDYARLTTTKADMDTIIKGIKTYETMRTDKQLPSNLGDLVTGVEKNKSKSGMETGALIDKENWTSDASTFVDQWDEPFIYDPSSRTLTSTNNGKDPIIMTF